MSCDSGGKDKTGSTGGIDTFEESSLVLPEGVNITSVDGDMTSVISGMDQDEMIAFSTCIQACNSSSTMDPDCFMNCMNTSDIFPDGGTFNLCMTVTNITSVNVTITISAGTRFNPADSDFQPMLVIYDITITITPGTSRYCIPVYCLARTKSAPSSSDDKYDEADMIPESGCLKDIVDITSTKDIESLSHTDLSSIQDIIWNCVDEGDFSSDDETFLNGLPDAD